MSALAGSLQIQTDNVNNGAQAARLAVCTTCTQSSLPIAVCALLGLAGVGPVLGQGAATILGQTPLEVQPASLITSGNQPTRFGAAVALDQNLLVVGAPTRTRPRVAPTPPRRSKT